MSPTVSQSGRRKPEVSVSDSGETRSFYSIQASPLKGAKLCLKEGMFTISPLLGTEHLLPCFALKRAGVASSIVQ